MYTAYDLPAVDALINKHMQILEQLCHAYLGNNFVSLILSGSFGRGEGSVLLHTDGTIEPLRDYDTRVIVQTRPAPTVLEAIRTAFMHVTKLGSTNELFSGENGFSLTLEPLTHEQLRGSFVRDRDLRVYDHIHASRVIYGPDYSAELQFPASDIPKVNGLRFLYQKMVGLVGHYTGLPSSSDLRRTLLYECDKTLIEICTALVLLADAYVPSYRQRAALFVQHWRDWFPELEQRLPQLDAQVERATQAKLFPGTVYALDPQLAFTQARTALLTVHEYYVQRLYNQVIQPGTRGCAQLTTLLYRDYFRVPVSAWLDQRRIDNWLTRWGLNTVYQYQQRFTFAQGQGLHNTRTWLGIMHAHTGPPIDIFLAAWCTLAACTPEPNIGLLNCAERMLARLPSASAPLLHRPTAHVHYRIVRERLIRAYATWEQHR